MKRGRKKGHKKPWGFTYKSCERLLKISCEARAKVAYNLIEQLANSRIRGREIRVSLIRHYLEHPYLVSPEYLFRIITLAQRNIKNPNLSLEAKVGLIKALNTPLFKRKAVEKVKKEKEEKPKSFEELYAEEDGI